MKAPVLDWKAPVFDREVVERARTVVLRAGWGVGSVGSPEAHKLPGLRPGLRRVAPRLQVGRDGPWGGALTERLAPISTSWERAAVGVSGPADSVDERRRQGDEVAARRGAT